MFILYLLAAIAGLFLLYVLFLGICALLVDPKKEYPKHSDFYRFLLDSATAAALKLLRISVRVTGAEQIPQDTGVLFVSNHRSNFDPIVTWYGLRRWKIAFVSKPENFRIPFFGRIIRKCCFLPIDREDPRKAIKTINQAAQLLHDRQVTVGIYPEGTRSRTGELLPFHNGVFKIAQKAHTPVVVLWVSGTDKLAKKPLLRKADVCVDVLSVLPAEYILQNKTEQIGLEVRRLMELQKEKEDA